MQTQIKIITLASLLFVISATVKAADMTAKPDCGQAKVVSGNSCDSLKVQISFDKCELKSEPKVVQAVNCDKSKATARYENNGYRYEAHLEQATDGWGAVTWNTPILKQWALSDGKVAAEVDKKDVDVKEAEAKAAEKKKERLAKKAALAAKKLAEKEKLKEQAAKESAAKEQAPPKVAANSEIVEQKRTIASLPAVVQPAASLQTVTNPVIPAVSATPVPTPAPTPEAAAAATTTAKPSEPSLKISGFMDVWLQNYSRDPRVGVSGGPESGFLLNDGALYLNYQKDALSFMLDVPFRRQKNSDEGVTTNPNASPNNNIVWGNDKAQAFVKYTAPENYEVVLGQFDTIYGVEVNDSKDRYFSKTGLLYDYMLPVTHMGAMVSYNFNGGYARVLGADPSNTGSLNSSGASTNSNNYEYGTAIGYSNDKIRGQIGYLIRPVVRADGFNGGRRALLDVTLGATLGKFSVDVEYDNLADDSKGTLNPSLTSETEAAGVGAMILASYCLSDKWTAGLRFEHLENDPGQISQPRQDAYALGVHYKWNASFESRGELMQYHYQEVSIPGNFTDNRVLLSNIFAF